MDLDPDAPVDLYVARSPFEADTIVACLKDRGFHAYAITIAASVVQWEGGLTNLPRVQVPRCELADAQAVLAAVKEQAKTIDWTQEPYDQTSGTEAGTEGEFDGSEQGLGGTPDEEVPLVEGAKHETNAESSARLPLQNIVWFGLFLLLTLVIAGLVVLVILIFANR